MFEGSDVENSAITIGKPKYRLPTPKYNLQTSGDEEGTTDENTEGQSPFISKIGGFAVWHDATTAPTGPSDIVCSNCNVSSEMSLIAQLYTPLDGLNRSLYVFCCNRRKCSLLSTGWKVVRNQCAKIVEEAPSVIPSTANEAASVSSAKTKASKESVWDFLTPALSKAGTKVKAPKKSSVDDSDWIFVDEDGGEDDDDLLAMLAQRDLSLQQTEQPTVCVPKHSTICVSNDKGSEIKDRESHKFLRTSRVFPSWRVEEIEEQWKEEFAQLDSDDEDGDPSIHTHHKDHIDKLLKSYLEDEDDPDIISFLRKRGHVGAEQGLGAAGKRAGEDGTTQPTNPANSTSAANKSKSKNMKKKMKRITKKVDDGSDDDQVDGAADKGDDVDENNVENRLSRSGASARAERYFQKRLQGQSWQVLRYAYGGRPLWSTNYSAQIVTSSTVTINGPPVYVPTCEICGSSRVFEFQLMPALLSLLERDTAQNTDTVRPVISAVMSTMTATPAVTTTDSDSKIETVTGSALAVAESSRAVPARSVAVQNLLLDVMGNGVDFGVVAVWSCPSSCCVRGKEDCKFATEAVLVQPPSDHT